VPRGFHALCALIALTAACGGSHSSTPAPTPVVNPNLTAPAPATPADNEQLDTLRPTLTVKNGTSDQPAGARTYEFEIADNADFTASLSMSVSFAAMISKAGIAEGTSGTTSLAVDTDLQPTTKFYWRARMAQGSTVSGWSPVAHFKSRLVGYIRAGELYDPLIHGVSVGELNGATEFIPGRGLKLVNNTSYVRYHLPQTVPDGEFSMDVEGLQANAPGNKSKVFGMQEGTGDFITNRYRVDVQYRGSSGVPPNCIQWRALFGSDDDKIEPETAKRFASVFALDPSHDYFWKGTWSNGFHLVVLDGGPEGSPLYDFGITANVAYTPSDHYAYLGAPTGRSGAESASVPGAIYRNVWLGNHPRPITLGNALTER
jgi:hypothetical protein